MPNRPTEAPGPRITVQLTGLDYALPGTLARRFMRCGKTNCRCKADPPTLHGPYLHWTLARRFMRCGKTNCRCKADPPPLQGPSRHGPPPAAGKPAPRTLPPAQPRRYQTWFDNARRVRDLLGELEARSLRAFEDAEG